MRNAIIKISGREVYYSGSIVTDLDDVITIKPFGDLGKYELKIQFINDPDKPASINNRPVGDIHLVEMVNFNALQTWADSKPVYVANYEGHKTLLHIATLKIGKDDATGRRVTNFTLYKGEAIGE